MNLKILNVEPEGYSQAANDILASLGHLDQFELSRAELLANVARYHVLMVRLGHQIDSDILKAGKNLKVIVSPTTGEDHIDLECARNQGIAVLSLKGETEFLENIPATSEFTFALILAVIRNLPAASNSVKEGVWNRNLFRGEDLSGKRLGIIGLGRIGKQVGKLGLAFGLEVGGFDIDPNKKPEGFRIFRSMEEVLSWSHIVSIHVPLNKETVSLIGSKELALLSPGSFLINTSRGAIIDEDALLEALSSRHLAGAALDVLRNEGDLSPWENGLLKYAREHHNLIITPHIGGATFDSMAKTEVFMANKLKAYLKAHNLIKLT